MRVVATVSETRSAVRQMGRPLGVVPTMGFLHEGHLSLVRRARAANKSVAVSVFVNPKQFGPGEDYATYPRSLEHDLMLLRHEGVDLVFAPSADELYPPEFGTYVLVEGITEPLEGAARPGHFRGVATVVAKLFNILQPDQAYFGQKDAQQALVIQTLVRDLDFPVRIEVLPTVRERDGLATSSRNAYLTQTERQAATVLSKSLLAAAQLFQEGEREAETLRLAMRRVLATESMAEVEYVSIADAQTLRELGTIDTQSALASLAVRFGRTRLIDNVRLSAPA